MSKRIKDDVKEVPRGMECGIRLQGCNDVKQDDVLEAYLNLVPVRGEDRHGNFRHATSPSGLFEPEALALYETIRQSQAKVYMKGAKGAKEMFI